MRICAAEAEGVHAGQSWFRSVGQRLDLRGDAQFQSIEVNIWVWLIEVQAGRNEAVMEHQRGLDDARGAGGHFEMADVCFHRADDAAIVERAAGTEHSAKRGGFDGIACGRAGAVCLDIAHIARINVRIAAGSAHQG